jgi:cyclohexanone monooxygenase
MLDNQAIHIAAVAKEVKNREAKGVEPTKEAEVAWVEHVTRKTFMTDYQGACTPGYYNGEGKQDGDGFLEAADPDGAVRFHEKLARWREQGDMEGLIVK